MIYKIIATSTEQTCALGRLIGRLAGPGQCIALEGILGAGKTQLVRGLAQGSNVADLSLVCSPTYCLLNVYQADTDLPNSRTVYHMDAYRVADAEQFAAVGFDELLDQGGLVVLEWASRVQGLLPSDYLEIRGEVEDQTTRLWRLRGTGPQSADLASHVDTSWQDNKS